MNTGHIKTLGTLRQVPALRRSRLIVLVLGTIAVVLAGRIAQGEVITFEESIPAPDSVRTQYCDPSIFSYGVEFLIPSPSIFEPPVATGSPTHALTTEDPGDEFDEFNVLKISFSTGQTQVGMDLGLDRGYAFGVTATVSAYNDADPDAGQLISVRPIFLGQGPTPITHPVWMTSTAGDIHSVKVVYTGPGPYDAAFEVIDNLTFADIGPPCVEDLDEPIVTITKPTTSPTLYDPRLEIAFEVTDYETGISAVRLTFRGLEGTDLGSFDYCGGSAAPACDAAGSPPTLTAEFATVVPDGVEYIEVEAWDFSGNRGMATCYVNYMAPGEDMNLWAQALEITQAVQSWVPVNETTRLPEGTPATFWYPDPPDSVPLVTGRTTVVRLYAGVEDTCAGVPVGGVEASLSCYLDPDYTLPCPGPASIHPEDRAPNVRPKIVVDPAHTLEDRRGDPTRSWNFVLPEEWTQAGNIYLEGRIMASDAAPECPGCDDVANRIRVAHIPFREVPGFGDALVHVLSMVRCCTTTPLDPLAPRPTDAQIRAHMDYIRKIYPVDEATVPNTAHGAWAFQSQYGETDCHCPAILGQLSALRVMGNTGNKPVALAIMDSTQPGLCPGLGRIGAAAARGDIVETSAHESGHGFGLRHCGNPGHGHECDNPAWCDDDWPWPHGTFPCYGFDIFDMDVIVPGTTEADTHDFMSYGGGSTQRWISSRNWIRLYNAFTAYDWPYPTGSRGEGEMGDYLMVRGYQDDTSDWSLLPAYELELPTGVHDDPGTGACSIELRDGLGQPLFTRHFDPEGGHIDGETPDAVTVLLPQFTQVLPLPPGVETITVLEGTSVLAERTRTANAPTIEITSPTESGFAGAPDAPVITWTADDADGDVLRFIVQYSPSLEPGFDGNVWHTLATDLSSNGAAVNPLLLPGGEEARVRIIMTDGFNSTVAVSPVFPVGCGPPDVTILALENDATLVEGNRIVFRGAGSDVTCGTLLPGELYWSSNLDGSLGTGQQLEISNLSVGSHLIELHGVNCCSEEGWDYINVNVLPSVNVQPIADAGPDEATNGLDPVQLDGSSSHDPDDDTLSFHWSIASKPEGTFPTLSDSSDPQPSFYPDGPGPYQFQLVVHDGEVPSLPDLVSIDNTDAIYVDDSATGGLNDGSSWEDAFTVLQSALNVATADTMILVAQGEYVPLLRTEPARERTETFQLADGLRLYGGYAGCGAMNPDLRDVDGFVTKLSGDLAGDDDPGTFPGGACYANNCYHVVTGDGVSTATVLDGFTVSGGYANGTSGQDNVGGGMKNYTGSPTVVNCTFHQNYATIGGGMWNDQYSSPILTNCAFTENRADQEAGALNNTHYSSPQVSGCYFLLNSATSNGGAMYNSWHSEPTLQSCTFEENSATLGYGGAIHNYYYFTLTLNDCAFTENWARGRGGAMYSHDGGDLALNRCTFERNRISVYQPDFRAGGAIGSLNNVNATLTDCTFLGNTSTRFAGAIFTWGNNGVFADLTLTNCVFIGNYAAEYGGAVLAYMKCRGVFTNCTFAGNYTLAGRAVACENDYNDEWHSDVQLTNCILWDDGDEIWNGDTSVIAVTYSDVQDGYTGTGNIDVDPLLLAYPDPGPDVEWGTSDDDYGDVHLNEDSPCIDAGSNYAIQLPPYDFDSEPRVGSCRVEMGADEIMDITPPLGDDCNDNSIPDYCEVYEGTSLDCNHNHIPDECDAIAGGDFDADGDVDLDDFAVLADCLGGPELPPVPGAPECVDACLGAFDSNADGDVDLADFAVFQGNYVGHSK